MARKNGRGMKAKGDAFERELAAYINKVLGSEMCSRAPLSGGGVVGQLSGGADLIGPPDIFVEAKRVERLSFPDAMAQAETNIIKTGSAEIPVVINRRNRQATGDAYTLMRLDAFLVFYVAYLKVTGVLSEDEANDAHARIKSLRLDR